MRLRLLASALACAAAPALFGEAVRETSQDFETIAVAKYVLNNNVWGKKDYSPAGWQTVYALNEAGPLSWGARYNWPVNGHPYKVKCYASVISGWHWGVWSKDRGFPVALAARRSVRTSGAFTITNPGVQNAAYDCWFHLDNHPTDQSRPTDELMIWVARYNGAGPLGTFVEKVAIGGAAWSVYKGDVDWSVFSFVREENAASWSFDLRDFTDYLVRTKRWMSAEKHMTSVQFGTEVFQTEGDGAFEVRDYRCDVE